MAGRIRSSTSSKGVSDRVWSYKTGTTEHGYEDDIGYPKSQLGRSNGYVTKTIEDEVTSNYHALIKKGVIINKPFKVTTVDYSHPLTSITVDYRESIPYSCNVNHGYPIDHFRHFARVGDFAIGWLVLPVSSAQLDLSADVISAAVTEAHANIDVSEMLALATAAESRKTVQSMMSIYGRLRKVLRHARKLRFRELRRELSPKELADRWMEVRYAIRPMIYDVVGIAESFQKKRGYIRRTFRGQSSDSMTIQDVVPKIGLVDFTYVDFTRTTELEVSARAGVLCDCSIDDITVFGVDQLATSAWELMPLSFVVDWFTNVGDWIAAHSPKAGVNQLASWVTTKSVLTQTVRSGNGYFDFSGSTKVGVQCSVPPSTLVRKETSLTRTTDPAISTFPSFDMNLDMYKLTDMGIILRNILK